VATGRGDLHGGATRHLPGDVEHVEPGGRLPLVVRRRRARHLVVGLPTEHREQVAQAGDTPHLHARDQPRLGEVGGGHDDPREAGPRRGKHRRERTAHRADPAIEAELAEQHPAQQGVGRHHTTRGQHGRREREVEAAAALGQRSR